MMSYTALKLVHIISSTLLFGTGLGTAFYMWRADRSRNPTVIAAVSRHVVIADWLFTAPAVIVQPLTGLAMLHLAQIPLTTPWVAASLILYGVTGLCWLPVVYLQIQVCRNARRLLQSSEPLNAAHDSYMRRWYLLGWPAFISVLLIFYLMVFKPVFG